MPLTRDESAFVRRRALFARTWGFLGPALLLTVVLLGGWLWFSSPLLVNPSAVAAGLRADAIPASTVAFMAAALPAVVLVCLLIVMVTLLFATLAHRNERRLIAIVRRLADGEGRAPGREAS